MIPPALLAPFVLLLLLIGIMPLMPPRIRRLWEFNYAYAPLGLALIVVVYYLVGVPGGAGLVAHASADYVSFISLIGSLYIVAGGIHIKVKDGATPLANVTFLAIGAVAANVLGTTGASMVLIRPWIRMNKLRIGAHHVVFFIFVVSNIGGALTPIADPPLFLGYLRGVPFFWLTGKVLLPWLVAIATTLAAFYAFDRFSFRQDLHQAPVEIVSTAETWGFDGGVNVLFLGAVIFAVFAPGAYFIREILMMGAAVASWFLTPKGVHEENHFSFGPIKEVASLFAGIFLTMLPVLAFLDQHGQAIAPTRPLHYYLVSGAVSSVLDNAPAYASFFQLAHTTAGAQTTAGLLSQQPLLVVAVSLGCVFFGAMTYIGNGPNFMVKAISQEAGVQCPGFFGYVFKYSIPVLLPILLIVGWLFL